jgi:hypothetical protein
MKLTPATFLIEPDHEFKGFDNGTRWNGFACPLFDFETASKIAIAMSDGVYSTSVDAFIFDPNSEDPYYFTGIEIEGQKLYPIGGGYWTWVIIPEL